MTCQRHQSVQYYLEERFRQVPTEKPYDKVTLSLGACMNSSADVSRPAWPSLPLDAWRETYAALHLRTQIVGKIRLSLSPWLNHSWHTTLYVTARGLTTSAVPCGSR